MSLILFFLLCEKPELMRIRDLKVRLFKVPLMYNNNKLYNNSSTPVEFSNIIIYLNISESDWLLQAWALHFF